MSLLSAGGPMLSGVAVAATAQTWSLLSVSLEDPEGDFPSILDDESWPDAASK